MESLSLRVWHPSPWHSVIQGEGWGVYRKGGWVEDVVFQILGERMHNNFVDLIII